VVQAAACASCRLAPSIRISTFLNIHGIPASAHGHGGGFEAEHGTDVPLSRCCKRYTYRLSQLSKRTSRASLVKLIVTKGIARDMYRLGCYRGKAAADGVTGVQLAVLEAEAQQRTALLRRQGTQLLGDSGAREGGLGIRFLFP